MVYARSGVKHNRIYSKWLRSGQEGPVRVRMENSPEATLWTQNLGRLTGQIACIYTNYSSCAYKPGEIYNFLIDRLACHPPEGLLGLP